MKPTGSSCSLLGSLLVSLATLHPAQAQIVPDTTLPENSRIAPGCVQCVIAGGTIRGTNLFHSFREFSIPTGGSAWFNNGAAIQNILTRVTGNSLSKIDGLLKTNGSANLFLINPNGIVFGRNARLDIGGSFSASTVDRFIFPDGSEFSATKPQAPPLLTMNLPMGLQYGNPIGQIEQAGTLVVPTGQQITLYGDRVANTGSLIAPGGRVHLLGNVIHVLEPAYIDVSSPTGGGTVLIGGDYQGQGIIPQATQTIVGANVTIQADAPNQGNGGKVIVWSKGATTFTGTISAQSQTGNGGLVEVSGSQLQFQGFVNTLAPNGQTGTLLLDPENITIVEDFLDVPDQLTENDQFTDPGINNTINIGTIAMAATNVILQATNNITFNADTFMLNPGVGLTAIAGNDIIVNNSIQATGTGNIQLQAGRNLTLTNSNAYVWTYGGDAELSAGGTISLLDGAQVDTAPSEGNSGNLTVNARSLILTNGSMLKVGPYFNGNGGNLTITTSEAVDLNGIGTDLFGNLSATGLNAGSIVSGSSGNAGNITVTTPRLRVRDGAAIGAPTFEPGAGGTIVINAPILVEVSGFTPSPTGEFLSGIFTSSASSGNAGNIQLTTGQLLVQNGGSIGASALADGNAGNIQVDATETLITGRSPDGSPSGLSTRSIGFGNGGNLTIRSTYLTIQDQAKLATEAVTGQGGNLALITQNLTVQDRAKISTEAFNSGNLTIQATERATLLDRSSLSTASFGGQAGDLSLTTKQLLVGNHTTLKTDGFGLGRAGNLTLNGSDSVNVFGESYLSVVATYGQGGTIAIDTTHFNLQGNSLISLNTFLGQPANLTINATKTINLDNGLISSFTFGSDNGGNLSLNTTRLTLTNSEISTDTFNSGNAGAITIQAKESTNLDNSLISSGTLGVGAGSSITIASPQLSLNKSAISSGTTGSSGNGGTIDIQASDRLELANNSNIDSGTMIGSGRGGDVNITVGRLLIRDRSLISAGSIASGQSGTINIQADDLAVQNQAWITVNSRSTTAPAGNIGLTADSIHLDRNAAITASSSSGDGGNITVRSPNILFLRRHSQISTTAGTAQAGGNGGNITISSPFIIAVLPENSDITANAFTGKGGNINITANGIFGLRFQPQLTPNSDITASSRFGINGTVTLNLLSIDPSQGFVALPGDVVDPTNQIQARCSGGSTRSSSFTQTGRGGIPSNPDDPLQDWTVAVDWIAQEHSDDRAVQSPSAQMTTPVAASESPQIVEAQGWVTSQNGAIYLVTQVPNALPHATWQNPINCLGQP